MQPQMENTPRNEPSRAPEPPSLAAVRRDSEPDLNTQFGVSRRGLGQQVEEVDAVEPDSETEKRSLVDRYLYDISRLSRFAFNLSGVSAGFVLYDLAVGRWDMVAFDAFMAAGSFLVGFLEARHDIHKREGGG